MLSRRVECFDIVEVAVRDRFGMRTAKMFHARACAMY